MVLRGQPGMAWALLWMLSERVCPLRVLGSIPRGALPLQSQRRAYHGQVPRTGKSWPGRRLKSPGGARLLDGHSLLPSPVGRGWGEGQGRSERTLVGPRLPYEDIQVGSSSRGGES